MQRLLTFLCGVLMSVPFFTNTAESAQPGSINWMTNYDEAIKLSQSTSKPIVLFFTGSDWCGWCQKLEQESLDTPEFAQAVGNKFIFVKLDFPVNSALPPAVSAQNKQLQKKYNVSGFPSLVIIDGRNQTQIGKTGYRPGGGRAYADHLSKIIGDFSSYEQKMQGVEKQKYSSVELKKLYETAQMFGYENDIQQIIKAGMASDDSQFFMIENYQMMAKKGLLDSPEAIQLKQKLVALDPQNEKMIQYQLALIDFEANSESMERKISSGSSSRLINRLHQ